MPYYALRTTLELGPVLPCFIGVSRERGDALVAAGMRVPEIVPVQGLIDTGASCTCVDPSVFETLGMSPTGKVPVYTPSTTEGTPHEANQYDISIRIPGFRDHDPPLIYLALPVIEANLSHQGYDALIGRDILNACLFVYDARSGFFTLAF